MLLNQKIKFSLSTLSSLLMLLCLSGLSQAVTTPSEYITLIQQKIGSNIIYPAEAMDKGWGGEVKVSFILMPNGQIGELKIIKSSGCPLLDRAVISAIARTVLSLPFETYSGKRTKVILPINYQAPVKPSLQKVKKAPTLPADKDKAIEKTLQAILGKVKEPGKPDTDDDRKTAVRYYDTDSDKMRAGERIINRKRQAKIKAAAATKETAPVPKELQDFIDLAIANNEPTQIAQQEVELARLEIREAQRNLFPGLKLEAYTTDGEVHKIGYRESEVKIQLDQPIYYSGRLKDSVKQAKVNLEITEANYSRLKTDISHKTEVAYYNIIGGWMNIDAQKAILREAKGILEIVQKQAASELATSLELSSAESWYEQIAFQHDSAEQDMAMAELTFMQVLNVSQPVQITEEKFELKQIDLSLDHWLEAGLEHRPEIHLSELLVNFHQYGKQIEKAKNDFTVDLTASYGHYRGAWDTEKMRDSDNWYIGVKAIKPWGANTIGGAAVTENVEPRFGQSSATTTSTLSAELNLLDNLKGLSEKKKADIGLQRSVSDLNETIKTINFEIKDAYLNYQKALLQAATAELETKFRHRQIEALKVQAQVGETQLSNVIQALINLSSAQSAHIQALTNCFISVANLKKAAGLTVVTHYSGFPS